MITPLGSKTIEEYRERLTNLSKRKIEKVNLSVKEDINKIVTQLTVEVDKGLLLARRGEETVIIIEKATENLKDTYDGMLKQQTEALTTFDKLESELGKLGKQIKALGLNPNEVPYFQKAIQESNKLYKKYTSTSKYWIEKIKLLV
tara:strand:+ start:577 stop:1014 length:438 start_codon:yes stop_codon:yes gene_type:complete